MKNRASYVGGSDLVDVLSIAPWGCPLRCWLRKVGRFHEAGPTNAMRRGADLEAIIGVEYQDRTERILRRRFTGASGSETYLLAHPDFHIVAFDDRGPGILSVKCLGQFQFRQARREGLSQAYVAQLQYEMGLLRWRWGSFAIFCAELWELESWDVGFDAALFDSIIELVHKFWALIENGPAPEKLPVNSSACRRCSNRAVCHPDEIPAYDGEIYRDDALIPLIAEEREAKKIIDEATEYRDELAAKIKALTVGHERTEAGPYVVGRWWTPQKEIKYTRKAFETMRVWEKGAK